MMKRFVLILAASAACLSQAAWADASGGYWGAGVTDQRHLHVVGGYDFNRVFGIELGWKNLGTYDVYSPPTINGSTVIGSAEESAVTLVTKIGYKFRSGWSVFGTLGAAQLWTTFRPGPGWTLTISNHERSWGFVEGVNGQYDFNATMGLRLCTEVIMAGNGTDYSGAGLLGYINASLLAVFKL